MNLKSSIKHENLRDASIHAAKKVLHKQGQMRDAEANNESYKAKMAKYLNGRAVEKFNNKNIDMMLDFNDLARQRWDTYLIIISVWNALYIPFWLAFDPPENFILELIMSIVHLSLLMDVII
jgi:hypothetical protein